MRAILSTCGPHAGLIASVPYLSTHLSNSLCRIRTTALRS